jgi:phosphoribosylformimino-5-aminoimidazole carboxamide ribotide isomerase
MDNEHSDFTIYPAIDLRAGKVVRLYQGNLERETIYGNDPAGMARHWLDQGARWLHVVNLDGAFDQPDQVNKNALKEIATTASRQDPPARIQFGGGLRTLEDCQAALDSGVSRLILGTLAIETPDILHQALQSWRADRICLAIDARGGQVQVRGWLKETAISANELAQWFAGLGGQTIIHTDITRDGSKSGLNLIATQELAVNSGLSVIASGGVASLADVRAVKAAGLSGIIIGRALYDGSIELKEALEC